jgi:hypothetical protein
MGLHLPRENHVTVNGDPINPWLYSPWPRFLASLKRMRERIAGGLQLRYWDSNTIGDKETSATWGQCSKEKEQWPDAEDHTWPDEFLKHGRVAPVYRNVADGQRCPFEVTNAGPGSGSGCFYRCRFFQSRKFERKLGLTVPTREEALQLYDATIEDAEKQTQNHAIQQAMAGLGRSIVVPGSLGFKSIQSGSF